MNARTIFNPTLALLAMTMLAAACPAQEITDAEKQRTTAVWQDLMNDIQPYRESLASWSVEFDSEKWYAQNRVMPDSPEDYKKIMDDLAAIEKLITSEKYKGLKGFFGPSDDIIHRPQNWLEICKARVEITQRVVKRELARILRPQIMPIQSMTKSVRDFDGWGLNDLGLDIVMGKRDAARKVVFGKVKALMDTVGLTAETRVDEFEKACDELVAASEAMAKVAKPAATYSMPPVAEALKKRWAAGSWANRKIVKINTESDKWKVTTNAVGTPLYRTVAVVVQFRLDGYANLIEFSTQVREVYKGGGKYEFAPSNISPQYRIIAPKP